MVKRKRHKWGKYAACLLSACLAGLTGCGGQTQEESIVVYEPETEGTAYQFAVVDIGDVSKVEKVKATYSQMAEQEVSFSISGKLIEKVYVKEGDSVKKGDLLAELSGGDLDRQIETLEYQIERNSLLLGYADTNESYEISAAWVNYLYKGWGTDESVKKSVETIQQNYRYLREDYNDAIELDQRKLDSLVREQKDSKVYASMNGVVYRLEENLEGKTSQRDETIMTIVDTEECLFETSVPKLAGYFHEGETVTMTLSSGKTAGEYVLMPTHMDKWGEEQYFSVFDGSYETGIEVGASGTIRIVTDCKEQVLRVPVSAINSADGEEYVYVLDQDGQRQVRWVKTGLHGDDMVEILSGLEEGEKVIRRW